MSLWAIVIVALGLSMDAFAVSLAASAAGYAADPRAVFRLSFHFGLFQFLMPILGWGFGTSIEPYVAAFDHWLAFGLLAVVGGHMIHAGIRPQAARQAGDPTRGLTLVILSTSTSLDALAVGLSLALAEVSVWYPSVVIGLITGAICLVAILLGNRIRAGLDRWAGIVGGVVLIVIAIRIVVSHAR
jgi:manganese efflux pump family protein